MVIECKRTILKALGKYRLHRNVVDFFSREKKKRTKRFFRLVCMWEIWLLGDESRCIDERSISSEQIVIFLFDTSYEFSCWFSRPIVCYPLKTLANWWHSLRLDIDRRGGIRNTKEKEGNNKLRLDESIIKKRTYCNDKIV